MKGGQKPTHSRLEGLGGFARRVSGLILPGQAADKISEDEKKRQNQKMFVEKRKSGVHVATAQRRPFYIGGHSGTKRDPNRVANERHRANKRARIARRWNRV